jgi:glutaredoxin
MAHVEIYTWSTCPFCHRAKKLLDRMALRKALSYAQ